VDLWFFPLAQEAPVWLNRPFVVTVHDIYPDIHQLSNSGYKQKLYLLMQRTIYRNAKKVISVSDNTKVDLIREMGITNDKITTIYHGIERDFFSPESNEKARLWVKEKYRISKPYFLYVGGFDPRKSIAELINVLASLKVDHQIPQKLVLAGQITKDCIPLFQRVSELHLFSEVYFLDYVLDEALRHLYAGATAFLFPSSYEGFGFPLLEAMACHAPIIAFDNSSITEVVGNVVPLVKTGDFTEFAKRMLEASRGNLKFSYNDINHIEEHLKNFTWANAASQTLHVYEFAINGK
jgi:glycosyltransferase involved in cell wall biosynthesis